jgi:hypothetical protein
MTAGLINGVSSANESAPGLLDTPTLDGCDSSGGSAEKLRLTKMTNDDVLSCFLPDGVSVGDVSGAVVSSAAKKSISSRIFASPRFIWVPVLAQINPQNGFYPVVGFQPAFITDESTSSTNGNSFATSNNGIIIQSSKVVSVFVVPINMDAMPDTADAGGEGTIPYIGMGPRIVQLVD